jgi:hypothetical protein
MQTASAAAGGVLTLFLTTLWPSEKQPPKRAQATIDGTVLSDGFENCSYYNFSTVYEPGGFCSHYAVRRTSAQLMEEANSRALGCAVADDLECILNAEVGFAIPSFWAFQHGELKMFVAPSLSPAEGAVAKEVRVRAPGSVSTRQLLNSVTVDYMPKDSRSPVQEVLSGPVAYCAQLLRGAYDPECWENLD